MIETIPLRHLAEVMVSTVDKKSVADQIPVRLCNYTDVYYQDVIDPETDFMAATATIEQVRAFSLRAGDILLTKDSETPDDIAVPAFVATDLPGVVSGYHLALVRADPSRVEQRFLFRIIQSDYMREQFAVAASGVTRYGLTYGAIRGAAVPLAVSELDEQRRIADFLDDQVSRIDGAVDARGEQLKLMAQRRESALEFIVLGRDRFEVVNAAWGPFQSHPASWREGQLRSVRCDVQTGPFGSQLHAEEYIDHGWPVVNPANIGPDGLIAIPECSVDENTKCGLSRHVLQLGDVVFGRRGELGRAGLVTWEQVGWVCGTGSLRVRLLDDQLSPDYLLRLLRTSALRYYFDTQAVGSTMANLNTGILMAMPLLLPKADEQVRIIANAREVESAHDELERLIRSQVLLLTERKRALITAAVTGEFDVTTASGRGVV